MHFEVAYETVMWEFAAVISLMFNCKEFYTCEFPSYTACSGLSVLHRTIHGHAYEFCPKSNCYLFQKAIYSWLIYIELRHRSYIHAVLLVVFFGLFLCLACSGMDWDVGMALLCPWVLKFWITFETCKCFPIPVWDRRLNLGLQRVRRAMSYCFLINFLS